jgi:hypothetical protein
MSAFLSFIANYIAANPQVVEGLITAIANIFTKNPTLLHAAVAVGINKVASTVPAEAVVVPVPVVAPIVA